MALTMTNKLRNANKRCLVCDEKIEGFLPAVPIVCPKVTLASEHPCVGETPSWPCMGSYNMECWATFGAHSRESPAGT